MQNLAIFALRYQCIFNIQGIECSINVCWHQHKTTVEHIQNRETDKVELKDNSRRAKLIINIFWGICILNLIAVINGYFELNLLKRIRDGGIYSVQEAESNDLRQGFIGIIQTGLYIASIVLFLNWFRRAYGNLHRIGIKNLEYSETMAVWSFFIPIISLYRPYKIAKEIAVETRNKLTEIIPDHKAASHLSILGFWWALFLMTNYIEQFAFKSILKDDTIDQMITSTQANMVSDFVDIPAAIVTLMMIKKISRDETLLFEKLNTGTNKV